MNCKTVSANAVGIAYLIRREIVAVGHPLVELADVREVRHQPSGTTLCLLAVEHQALFLVLFIVFIVVVLLVHCGRVFLNLLRRRFPIEQRHNITNRLFEIRTRSARERTRRETRAKS